MFKTLVRSTLLTCVVLEAPRGLHAKDVELRSGATLVGDVRLEGANQIAVDARYPEARTVNVSPDNVTPGSLHAVLEWRQD